MPRPVLCREATKADKYRNRGQHGTPTAGRHGAATVYGADSGHAAWCRCGTACPVRGHGAIVGQVAQTFGVEAVTRHVCVDAAAGSKSELKSTRMKAISLNR